MSKTVCFVGLNFAHENYFQLHKRVFKNKNWNVLSCKVDVDKGISGVFRRRSFVSMPLEVVYFIFFVIKHRPNLIITAGPKLGLILSCVAFFFPAVKHAHWYTGQVWANELEPKKAISFWSDWIIAKKANYLFCDSNSQKSFIYSKLGLSNINIYVPEGGSINGVREEFYSQQVTRVDYHSKDRTLNVVFLGRKCEDKGVKLIPKIAEAFSSKNVHFTLAGPVDETFESYSSWRAETILNHQNISFIDNYTDAALLFSSSDVLLLPSYREGFGNVVIEAQALGNVVVCSDIYGLRDSFLDGQTGFRCNNSDLNTYIKSIDKLLEIHELQEMSSKAIAFANNYQQHVFIKKLEELYVSAGVFEC